MLVVFFNQPLFTKKKRYIYIYRWVQITPSVTLKIYTFFKPLNLSRFNGQKKTLVNVIILIDLNYYPLFNTFHTYF